MYIKNYFNLNIKKMYLFLQNMEVKYSFTTKHRQYYINVKITNTKYDP